MTNVFTSDSKGYVKPSGPRDAEIVFVDESPIDEELNLGQSFTGKIGMVFTNKLTSLGINIEQCYTTNLVKHSPIQWFNLTGSKRPKGKDDFNIFWVGDRPSEPLLRWRDLLLEELASLPNVKVIYALGAQALWALTGETKIAKWRGSILYCSHENSLKHRNIPIIPTYRPAKAIPDWSKWPTIEADIMKGLRVSKPGWSPPNPNLIISPTESQICTYFAKHAKDKLVMYDIETSPRDGVSCIAFAYNTEEALCVPTTVKYWGTIHQLQNIIRKIAGELTRPDKIRVAQNHTFELLYLSRFWHILPGKPWEDTMLMQHACYPELPKGLAYQASIYTDYNYYKDDLKSWVGGELSDEDSWLYNARDAVVQMTCMKALEEEMDELGVRHTYEFMLSLLEPITYMMLRGLRVDEVKRIEHAEEMLPKLDALIKDLQERYGVNPSSPTQVIEYIKRKGLRVPTHRGKPSTMKKKLLQLAAKDKEFGEIIYAREQRTTTSNFLFTNSDPIDCRLRCSINITGTETGRLSSNESIFGTGRNLQNIPKMLRDIYVPDKGKVFWAADLAGAEARVVAYLAEDPVLIQLIKAGDNIHNYTARLMFGVTDEEIAEDKARCKKEGRPNDSYYSRAKKGRHALHYLIGPRTFAEDMRIPFSEAVALLRKLRSNSTHILGWQESTKAQLRKTRMLTTLAPFRRKRYFFEQYGDALWREGVAYVPQSTVPDIIDRGITRIYNELCPKFEGVEVLLQIHDEVMGQCYEHELEEVITALPELLRVPLTCHGRTFEIPVEISYGKNWKDMVEV